MRRRGRHTPAAAAAAASFTALSRLSLRLSLGECRSRNQRRRGHSREGRFGE